MANFIGSGRTPPGATDWKPYLGGTTGIFVHVDTSAVQFPSTPAYVASLACATSAWATTGGSVVYKPTPTGFRIYVRRSNGAPITPADANTWQWHINWVGVI